MRFALTILFGLFAASSAIADTIAPQLTSPAPWEKTFVFEFPAATFYVPAVWVMGTHKSVPAYKGWDNTPDGTVFREMEWINLYPLQPDFNIGPNQTMPEALKMEHPRLVAGKSFLIDQIGIFLSSTKPGYIEQHFPNGLWDNVKKANMLICPTSSFVGLDDPEKTKFGLIFHVRLDDRPSTAFQSNTTGTDLMLIQKPGNNRIAGSSNC